jgi:hydrogenase nickel incorporation protein HypB
MCGTCGCGDPEIVPVDVHERILSGNDARAAHNREHFAERGLAVVNLMGSPGSGKTAMLEATARDPRVMRLGAIAGDLETDHDARRLIAAGIRSTAITTGSACHLDAQQIHRALHEFDINSLDALFIENVGNLVCPAIYDLGQTANVVALSVTEGEDKPLKYPVMFRAANLVLITKVDLLPHLPGISIERIADALARVMPSPKYFAVSAVSGQGIGEWIDWLEQLKKNTFPSHDGRAARGDRHEHSHEHESAEIVR